MINDNIINALRVRVLARIKRGVDNLNTMNLSHDRIPTEIYEYVDKYRFVENLGIPAREIFHIRNEDQRGSIRIEWYDISYKDTSTMEPRPMFDVPSLIPEKDCVSYLTTMPHMRQDNSNDEFKCDHRLPALNVEDTNSINFIKLPSLMNDGI